MIQVAERGVTFSGFEKDLKRLRDEFGEKHFIHLPRFLGPELLKSIQSQLHRSDFIEKRYKVGKETAIDYRPRNKSVVHLLNFLINDPLLFQLIQQITGGKKIGCFNGRISRKIPGKGQYVSWHDDWAYHRMIGLSINLSNGMYLGGVFEIRNRIKNKIVQKIVNSGRGDAILFRLASYLQHRVTRVYGKVARTVFTGWFRSRPLYKPLFKPFLGKRVGRLEKKLSRQNDSPLLRDFTLRAKRNLYYRNLDERLLVFNPKNHVCYGFDAVGARLFTLLREPKTVRQLRNTILNEYEVAPEKCEGDLLHLRKILIRSDLIEISEEGKTR